jgi:hypothetical protein
LAAAAGSGIRAVGMSYLEDSGAEALSLLPSGD